MRHVPQKGEWRPRTLGRRDTTSGTMASDKLRYRVKTLGTCRLAGSGPAFFLPKRHSTSCAFIRSSASSNRRCRTLTDFPVPMQNACRRNEYPDALPDEHGEALVLVEERAERVESPVAARPLGCENGGLGRAMKRRNFARERRLEGRALTKAVRELAALAVPSAAEHGIDLQARLRDAATEREHERQRLAERLQQSVAPLFVTDDCPRPRRIGSCVLVRLETEYYAFTAAHVIEEIGSSRVWAPSTAAGGKLLPLPGCTAHLSPAGSHLDVGVLVLTSDNLGPFQEHVFLGDREIDQDDRPDDRVLGPSFYFVLGYSASRTQVNVSKAEHRIFQKSFHCVTSPVTPAEYAAEDVAQEDHILLDFDHCEITVGGSRADTQRLQGASGDGIFHIARSTMQGPLVAIATQNRRNSRIILGTRIKHFLEMVCKLNSTSPHGPL